MWGRPFVLWWLRLGRAWLIFNLGAIDGWAMARVILWVAVLWGIIAPLCLAEPVALAAPKTLRIATFNVDLSRRGPGLLYGALQKGGDAQIAAVQAQIAHVRPDVLLLTGFDYDAGGAALAAFAQGLESRGVRYPHRFARRPNTGMASGLDLDGDGRLGGAGDAQGWGRFAGANGMALLSRFAIRDDLAHDFSEFLWQDLPGALVPQREGQPFPSAMARAAQRLPTTGHWDVPIELPSGHLLSLWAFYASPPVFDGPEDRNGLRNHDETAFWLRYLDGDLPQKPRFGPFVVLGDINLDTHDGDGRPEALRALLGHPLLQDPAPESPGGAAAGTALANAGHIGRAALDTASWPNPTGPGNLRLDYVLPSVDLQVLAAGVFWPAPDAPVAALLQGADGPASPHRLVWVDVVMP